MTDQFAHYQAHPPRCIASFASQPFGLDPVSFDGHGGDSVNTGFSLACACGGRFHLLSGYIWRGEEGDSSVVVGPITTECTQCQKQHVLFDTESHGYDTELGHGSAHVRAQGTPGTLECERDRERQMEVLVRFEYPTDLLGEEFADHRGREQDLFTWISLYGRCRKCQEIWTLAEFECA